VSPFATEAVLVGLLVKDFATSANQSEVAAALVSLPQEPSQQLNWLAFSTREERS